ncbi:zinc ribbon domain-containing protein [Synechococcus sp. B60.1]|uniref:zinc ribbon domain-containing protein n=1 Tax=unclassified Synechococcus TaxID=2626047 RepID=UPI0039C2ED5A
MVDVSEAYTSQTCTRCGSVHSGLQGSRVFRCPVCKHTLPRDWNGALGIFLRALRDVAILWGLRPAVANSGVQRDCIRTSKRRSIQPDAASIPWRPTPIPGRRAPAVG